MESSTAQKYIKLILWVVGSLFFFVATVSCKSKAKSISDTDAVEQSLLSKQEIEDFVCSQQKHDSVIKSPPLLEAHFFVQSFDAKLELQDLFFNLQTDKEKAPSPIPVKKSSVGSGPWILSVTPDFFLWQINVKHDYNQSFYITGKDGFPLQSKTIKLKNDHGSSLVLLLNSSLKPNTQYYIYMIFSENNKRKKWVQSLMIN